MDFNEEVIAIQDINVKFNVFEGPMELLYHLIEKNEIDIYDIPIAELADQYIDYIKKFPKDMESISNFLIMASSLLEIKSKMLIPKPKIQEEENYDDPRAELVKRLLEYKKFKEISNLLKSRQEDGYSVVFKESEDEIKTISAANTPEIEDILSNVTMDTLLDIFKDVLKRKDLKVDKIRSTFNSVKKDPFTIEEKISYIKEILRTKKSFSFEEIFKNDTEKIEVVTTFLALLELIKIKEIKVQQVDTFDKIIISKY